MFCLSSKTENIGFFTNMLDFPFPFKLIMEHPGRNMLLHTIHSWADYEFMQYGTHDVC